MVLKSVSKRQKENLARSGADPGFPIGGGANPEGGGANIQFCQIFQKAA